MRSAYFRVRWVAKGVNPFHRARTPSWRDTCWPQSTMPLYWPAWSSWRRVLMVSGESGERERQKRREGTRRWE
jgi:hypothetical protein